MKYIKSNLKNRIIMIAICVLFLLPAISALYTPTAHARVWLPELTVTSIELEHGSDEPTIENEYRNETHKVVISVQNTGNVVLTNLSVNYWVRRNSIIDHSGYDITKSKLKISEVYSVKFDWKPVKGDNTKYNIAVLASASNFGIDIEPFYVEKFFIINDVQKDVGPVGYSFDPPAATLAGEISNQSHYLTAVVMNMGNFKITTAFTVSAAIYSSATLQQLWTDSKIHSGSIFANDDVQIKFNTPWAPPIIGLYFLNISASLSGDNKPINNNYTSEVPIIVGDVLDAEVFDLSDFEPGSMYQVAPISVVAKIANSGNLNFTAPFSALLKINTYPSGTTLFAPAPVQIPYTGGQNISAPGSTFDAIFPTWDFPQGLAPGKVWLNISINPTEMNGSGLNNNYSNLIELKNQTIIDLNIETPLTGVHFYNDLNSVKVNVSNIGTKQLARYILKLSLLNKDTDVNWINYTGIDVPGGLLINSYKVHTFSEWNISYNSNLTLTATLALHSAPESILATSTRSFELKGGPVLGTIAGTVFDGASGPALEDILVKVYIPIETNPKYTTHTASDGTFFVTVDALPKGVTYSVIVSDEDNYWWVSESKSVNVYSGRETQLVLSLNRKLTGTLKGNVSLTTSAGAPEVKPEWSGIKIYVEDTKINFSTDAQGRFESELVAGVINLSASKNHYDYDRLEYVSIIPGVTKTVEFTLIEDWSVRLTPANNEDDVGADTGIVATFDEPLKRSSVTPSSFGILDSSGKLLNGLSVNDYGFYKENKTCRLKPPNGLDYDSTYYLVLTQDLITTSGSPIIHRDWQSQFTTERGFGTLTGTVTYYWSRRPLEGLTVNLTDEPDFNTTTDDNGGYIFENVPSGSYELNVYNIGYSPKHVEITIIPEQKLWKNITFDDALPIPSLWAKNEFGRKILIEDNMTERIAITTEFTLTSNIPLNPDTISEKTVRITEHDTSERISFKTIIWDQNRFSFILEPGKNLRYNATYEVTYGRALETNDGREIFWRNWSYSSFKTELYAWHPLSKPRITPVDSAINVPINATVEIDFPVAMNRTSVEQLINASFSITGFHWDSENISVVIIHQKFDYATTYKITLGVGISSADDFYRLLEPVTFSFTTLSGLITHVIGPILDSKDKPIENVSVIIYDSEDNLVKSFGTNSEGFATFFFEEPLEPGNYTLKLIRPGYKITTMEFEVYANGTPVFSEPLPRLEKTEKKTEDSSLLIIGLAAITVLVIILVIAMYFIMIKGKKRGRVSEEDQEEDKLELDEEPEARTPIKPSKLQITPKDKKPRRPEQKPKAKDNGKGKQGPDDLLKKVKLESAKKQPHKNDGAPKKPEDTIKALNKIKTRQSKR